MERADCKRKNPRKFDVLWQAGDLDSLAPLFRWRPVQHARAILPLAAPFLQHRPLKRHATMLLIAELLRSMTPYAMRETIRSAARCSAANREATNIAAKPSNELPVRCSRWRPIVTHLAAKRGSLVDTEFARKVSIARSRNERRDGFGACYGRGSAAHCALDESCVSIAETEQNWTSEAQFIAGDRTSEPLLRNDLRSRPHASLLKWVVRETATPRGCVLLEPLDDATWYLGSLAVDPSLQNAGCGSALLESAEEWVRVRGGERIRMTVVNVRETLIEWYLRRGYRLTGESEPFPYGDNRFGRPMRDDLRFLVLEKDLMQSSPWPRVRDR